MHNEEAYLIIYCLNCMRCMQNSTFETGLIFDLILFMCSLLHKVISHDINAFNQLRTMVMGQLLGSRVACNMHRFLVKL